MPKYLVWIRPYFNENLLFQFSHRSTHCHFLSSVLHCPRTWMIFLRILQLWKTFTKCWQFSGTLFWSASLDSSRSRLRKMISVIPQRSGFVVISSFRSSHQLPVFFSSLSFRHSVWQSIIIIKLKIYIGSQFHLFEFLRTLFYSNIQIGKKSIWKWNL